MVRGLAGWITVPDGARLASVGTSAAVLGGPDGLGGVTPGGQVRVDVDPSARAQPMAGFGAALTESSAVLLRGLPDDQRAAVLSSLFDPAHGAGLSVVRVPMGASDFARTHYTYDDLPAVQTDPDLARFSVARDDAAVVPVLREIMAINPGVHVVASPWSAPAWMKTSGRLGGGSLRPEWADAWARYFVRFVQAYAERGIPVSAVTVQNEPGHSDPSYPTMTMSAPEQAAFVATHLGPAFAAARLPTQIIGYDHNWDEPWYPSALLGDAAASRYLAGVAWHCYRGDPSAQSDVRRRFPGKSVWLTECSGGGWHGSAAASFGWLADIVIGAVRNWAGSALLWNLALDGDNGPHRGGCGDCRGVLTVTPRQGSDLGSINRSLEFDLLSLASRAAPRGSVRVKSQASSGMVSSAAFVTADGQRSLLIHNWAGTSIAVSVRDGGPVFTVMLPAHALATLRWRP
jgi:glucosylceramidase